MVNRLTLCMVALLMLTLVPVSASGTGEARELLFDVQPVTLEGRTLVPLRPIFEWIGARVTYDEGHIRAYRSEAATVPQVELWIGSTAARIVEATYHLDVTPQLINGRAFVPLRFVAESFGVWVEAEGGQMRLSLPQEDRVAVLAIPPHPEAHLGKIWRVIEHWYDVLPPGENLERSRASHWKLCSREKQRQLTEELGENAPRIVDARRDRRPIRGIRILDGHVGAGAESGWAQVMVGYADGATEIHRFDFVREPTGWKVSRFAPAGVDPGNVVTEETPTEEDYDG